MAAVSSLSTLALALSGLAAKHPDQHVWIDGDGHLAIGTYPQIQATYDFVAESVAWKASETAMLVETKLTDRSVGSDELKIVDLLAEAGRLRSVYNLRIGRTLYKVGSLKQSLIVGLEKMEEVAPGTLDKLSSEKKRSKRPVAKRREDLYATYHPEGHSHELRNGYFVATNNNESEVRDFLWRAAEIAGLSGGGYEFGYAG